MLRVLLMVLHWFVGVGAIIGGGASILNPETPLGITTEALKNAPFTNFLIPGIILFTILGLGNIVGALAMMFKSKYQGCISCAVGGGLMIWIVVQCIMLQGVHFLHIFFFIVGLVQFLIAAVDVLRKRLFPANILFNLYEKAQKRTV